MWGFDSHLGLAFFQVPSGSNCKIFHLNVTIKFSFFPKMASLLIWKKFGKVCQKCIGKDLNMKSGHFSHNKYGLIVSCNDIYHNIELCLINLGVIFGVRTCRTPRWYQKNQTIAQAIETKRKYHWFLQWGKLKFGYILPLESERIKSTCIAKKL